MFDEENQDMGLALMLAHGFRIGRIIYPLSESVYPNAIVSTVEDGDFWNGDLEIGDMTQLHAVAVAMNKTLIIESQTKTNHGFTVAV